MLVLRELLLGPRRFSDLQARSARDQRQCADPAPDGAGGSAGSSASASCRRRLRSRSMRRRDWGLRPRRSSQALGRWAARSPLPRPDAADQPGVAHAVAADHARSPKRPTGLEGRIGFRFGETGYLGDAARRASSQSSAAEPTDRDVTFTGTPTAARRRDLRRRAARLDRRRRRPASSPKRFVDPLPAAATRSRAIRC